MDKANDMVNVKMMQVLYETDLVKVWVERLQPQQRFPKHRHTVVSDVYYVVSGILTVEMNEPTETVEIRPDETYRVRPGRPHRTINTHDETVEWILIQGLGKADFKEIA